MDDRRTQTQTRDSNSAMAYHAAFSGYAVKSATIIGAKVFNRQSEHVGKVEEVVVNVLDGNIAYLVITFGGFLGMGEKLYAVPWKALYYDHALEAYLLNVSKEQIERAPAFEKEAWSHFGDESWNRGIHDYYEVPPFWIR